MKNVTLRIDDHVLDRARKLAGERGTSVDQMIRDFLARETGTETEDAARARMRAGRDGAHSRPAGSTAGPGTARRSMPSVFLDTNVLIYAAIGRETRATQV